MDKKTATTMPKTYNPHEHEQKLYEWWESKGFFKPETQYRLGLVKPGRTPFVISMPPPNVTGALHLGHAITASIEDMLIRYHRMLGDPTLWVPGTDHAGIATQNVVERKLAERGLTRHDLGREKFVEEVWKWKAEYHARITNQHRRLGVSCDWDRERFTLDEGLSRAVREAFVRWYKQGLIYRGTYLVNWCPRCESAISDLEVNHVDEQGTMYYFRYPIEGEPQERWLPVATTRPETILGDTAVAVHPDDERYKDFVGKTALVPMLNRRIPVITDEYVDREFGTGALKITPGHDPNDYEIGLKHGLEMVDILNDNGTLNENAGPYAGLDRYKAREKLWADMKAAGMVIKEEPHTHALGHCDRCGTVIEPRLSTQWFVKGKPIAAPAIQAVREGRIRIVPERFHKEYFHWMENIRDWCISRQLWWGHRIPVWYCDDCGGQSCSTTDPTVCEHCGSPNIHQDADVLDTWFSSGLWPFSTLGWPDDTEDLRTYYPTTVLETGYDILFFWVARMIMMGISFTGQEPFRWVYLHGLVRDEHGRKMSKSLGNALDPMDLIEEYGTDALRFTLLTGSTPGNDMRLSTTKLTSNRNFANKIWNAARFVITNLDEGMETPASTDIEAAMPHLALADRWILSRHNRLIADVTRLIDNWQLGEAGRQIYEFLWGEYCDWYIETAKIRLYGDDPAAAERTRQVLVYVLERTLRLLHPYMPFITEAIWQNLPRPNDTPALMMARWPYPETVDEQAEIDFDRIREMVRAIRNARTEYNVTPGRRIPALIAADGHLDLVKAERETLTTLARLDAQQLTLTTQLEAPDKAITLVAGGATIYLPLAGMINLEAEQARLRKELEDAQAQLARVEKLLGNEKFVTKAPPEVVQREREKQAKLQARIAQLNARITELS